MESCSPEMMREHERRITETEQSNKSAHKRVDGIVKLIQDFTTEMRESNKNIGDMVNQVGILTAEIKHVVEATKRHDEDIETIKDNMETKDTVLNLYKKIECSDEKHEKGMDAIMGILRQQQAEFDEHKREPEKEAYQREKSLKKWLVGAVGAIIASQYLPDILKAITTLLKN
jgi:chromosome segregation ATPase